MERMIAFIVPNIGTGLWQAILTIINIVLLLFSIFTLGYFGLCLSKQCHSRQEVLTKTSRTNRGVVLLIAAGVVIGFGAIYDYMCQQIAAEPTFEFNSILNLLDHVFCLQSLSKIPIDNITGFNMLVRVLMLCSIVWLVHRTYQLAQAGVAAFEGYTENLICGIFQTKESEPKPATETRPEYKWFKIILVVIAVLFISGVIYLGNDQENALLQVFDWLSDVLEHITLIANIQSPQEDIGQMLKNFCLVICSIFIVMVYLSIINLLYTFVKAITKHRNSIIKWIVSHAKEIAKVGGIILIILSLSTIVYFVIDQYSTIIEKLSPMFDMSSQTVFGVIINFILLVFALCIAILLFAFMAFFSYFLVLFLYNLGKQIWTSLKTSEQLGKYAKVATILLVSCGIIISVFLGYTNIQGWFVSLFETKNVNVTPIWVVQRCFLMVIAMLGLILTCLAALMLIALAIRNFCRLLTNSEISSSSKFIKVLKSLWDRILDFLQLLSKVIKHVFDALQNFCETLLRIFTGYKTESQKNNALFVAACFASLASLLNTYYGLKDFYNSDKTLIPVIISFSIACAVQFAMLIFGMKAGEGMAENMISNCYLTGRNYARVIIGKLFRCFFYLFFYLSAWIILIGFMQGKQLSFALETVLPILFIILSTICFVYAIVMQIIDIISLWKARKKENNGQKNQFGVDSSVELPLGKTKRIPAKYYLAAYALLVIVSTGFAFANLFSYYADQVNLHEVVFDQIQNKADTQVEEWTNKLIAGYNDAVNSALEQLNERITEIDAQHEKNQKILIDKIKEAKEIAKDIEKDETVGAQEDVQREYLGRTKDYQKTVSTLKTYINIDHNILPDEAKITIYSYDHYWGDNTSIFYTTKCIVLNNDNANPIVGQYIELNPIETITTTNEEGKTVTWKFIARNADPDSMLQSVVISQTTIENATKYNVIYELLNIFESYASYIGGFEKAQTPKENNIHEATEQSETTEQGDTTDTIRKTIKQLETLDVVRQNIVNLCVSETPNETDEDESKSTQSLNNSINQLPKIISSFLMKASIPEDSEAVSDSSENRMDDVENQNNVVSEKQSNYNEFNRYMSKLIGLCNVLSQVDHVLDDDSPSNDEESTSEQTQDTGASQDIIRQYLSYAQSIANSNFHISYDALLRGAFKTLNEYSDTIDALYQAQVIAIFMLIICILVDSMAFFAGLLLFQDAFLLERNKAIEQVGYINFDAALTNYFMPPNTKGPELLLHKAMIYRILYGDPIGVEQDSSSHIMDNESYKVFSSVDFMMHYSRVCKVLEDKGISESSADLQLWLAAFVRKNGITFDDLLSK